MLTSILAFSLFACGPKAPPATPSFPAPPTELDGKKPSEAISLAYGRSLAILIGDGSDARTAPSLQKLSSSLVSAGFEVMPIAEAPTSSKAFQSQVIAAKKNDIQNVDRLFVYYVGGAASSSEGAFELAPNGNSVVSLKEIQSQWGPYVRHLFVAVDACSDVLDPALKMNLSAPKRHSELPKALVQARTVAVVAGHGKECQATHKQARAITPLTQAIISGLGRGHADLNADGLVTDREWFSAYRHHLASSSSQRPVAVESGGGAIVFSNPKQEVLRLSSPYEAARVFSGSFSMGSVASENLALHRSDELLHRVSLTQDLYVGRTEVPQSLWLALDLPNPSVHQDDAAPVNNVSWYDAIRFANALSKKQGLSPCYQVNMRRFRNKVKWVEGPACTGWRLPTEAEWEYVARAGSDLNFTTNNGAESLPGDFANEDGCEPAVLSKGTQLDSLAWYCNNSAKPHNHPKGVGLLEANAFGLYDVHGNVWEWVWDRYGPYPKDEVSNPLGAKKSTSCGNAKNARVRRGGSWINDARSLRLAFRNCLNPVDSRSHIGFRLVRTAEPLPPLSIEGAAIAPAVELNPNPSSTDASPKTESKKSEKSSPNSSAIKGETSESAAAPSKATEANLDAPLRPSKAPVEKAAEQANPESKSADQPAKEATPASDEPKRKRGKQISKPDAKGDTAKD